MNQIERVRKMEELLNKAQDVIDRISVALEENTVTDSLKNEYEDIQETILVLQNYYEGEEWKEDYELDSEGGFPPCLNRGVLSEDAVYDLLTDNDIIKDELELD